MSSDEKKIAFSFLKVKKSAIINKPHPETKDKIEYVDCFDGSKGKFSYKGTIRNEPEKQELVIPMPTTRSSIDIFKSRGGKVDEGTDLDKKIGPEEKKTGIIQESLISIKNIDELAVCEILKETQNESAETKSTEKLVIETKSFPDAPSETDIDYNNVPVKDFGLALLRGMGWRPDLGIGKEPRLVEAVSPKLRPKGLGLGALLKPEPNNGKKKDEEKEVHKRSISGSSHKKHKDSKSVKEKR